MSSESIGQSAPAIKPLDKSARLKKIFEVLASYPNAVSAKGAHRLLTLAFESIENDPKIPHEQKGGEMNATHLGWHKEISYNGKNIQYETYKKHIVFIGSNGSIEILKDDADPETDARQSRGMNIQDMKDNLPSAFSKPGADGKNVWGN